MNVRLLSLALVLSSLLGCGSSEPDDPRVNDDGTSGSHRLGAFELQVGDDESVRVVEASHPDHVLFEASSAFVEAGAGDDSLVERSG